jgi:hypothetical protein
MRTNKQYSKEKLELYTTQRIQNKVIVVINKTFEKLAREKKINSGKFSLNAKLFMILGVEWPA